MSITLVRKGRSRERSEKLKNDDLVTVTCASDLSRPRWELRAMPFSLAFFLALSVLGCRTREEGAQRAGREAALVAVHDCAGDAGLAEICRVSICRDCARPFRDSVTLTETCTAKCMGQGPATPTPMAIKS